MNDWLDELADALGVPRITPDELGAMLKTARDVAHGVERRFAPVSAFLIGTAVGRRTADGEDRAEAFGAAIAEARRLIPEDDVVEGTDAG